MHPPSNHIQRSKTARPEQDIRSIDFSAHIDPELQLKGDPPLDQIEALKIIRAEVCPRQSFPEMGERMADKILLSYDSAMAVAVGFMLPKGFPIESKRQSKFQIYKEKPTVKNANLDSNGQGRCEYRCALESFTEIAIGTEKHRLGLAVDTRETPLPLKSRKKCLAKPIKDKNLPKDSRSQIPRMESFYPMFGVLQGVLECMGYRSYPDMQALGLDFADMAFQRADESIACNYLTEITIRGHPWERSTTNVKRAILDKFTNRPDSKQRSFMIRLHRSDYEKSRGSTIEDRPADSMHRAYIALGSNVGDRLGMIESACLEMDRRGISVVRTSGLYETEPMYLEDQQPFTNGACEVCNMLT